MKLIRSHLQCKCRDCGGDIISGWRYALGKNKFIHFECRVKNLKVEPVVGFKLVSDAGS